MMDLSGKNVCFVAGLGGIGYESCKNFLKKNIANLAILDCIEDAAAVKRLVDEFPSTNIFYMKMDITKKSCIETCIKEVVKRMKYIDVLVNGAGVIADRDVEFTMNVNLVGLINTTLIAMPYMDKNNGGRGGMIVNIASVLGLEPCSPIAVYSASKFGVIGFTRSMADEFYYKKTGIAFCAICPGLTYTTLIHTLDGRDTFDYSKELSDKFLAAKTQKVEDMGYNLVKGVEMWKNGAMWICDMGTIKEAEPKLFWEMKF